MSQLYALTFYSADYTTLLEELEMRMNTKTDLDNLVTLFQNSKPSVAEMLCSINIERVFQVYQIYLFRRFDQILIKTLFFYGRI